MIRRVYSWSSNQMKYSLNGSPYSAMVQRGTRTETNEQYSTRTTGSPRTRRLPQSQVVPGLFISQTSPSIHWTTEQANGSRMSICFSAASRPESSSPSASGSA